MNAISYENASRVHLCQIIWRLAQVFIIIIIIIVVVVVVDDDDDYYLSKWISSTFSGKSNFELLKLVIFSKCLCMVAI